MKKELRISRNRTMDIVIGTPMLFLTVAGIYQFFAGNVRKDSFYIYLVAVTVCPLVFAYIIYKLVYNKPFVILNKEGIYLSTINRTIEWRNVGNIKIEEEDYTFKESPGVGLDAMKYYLVVFEITERKPDGNYGHDRKLCTNYTNYSGDDLLEVCREYWSYYKVKGE